MKSIEELRETKGTFSIGQAISDGWRIVSKQLGYYIGAGVITVIITITPLLVCRLGLCVAYQQSKLQKIGCWCDLLFLSYALNLNTNNGVKESLDRNNS